MPSLYVFQKYFFGKPIKKDCKNILKKDCKNILNEVIECFAVESKTDNCSEILRQYRICKK